MVARITLVAVFVAFVLWDLWEAVGNLIGLPPYYDALGFSDSVPWLLLVIGIALPLVGLSVGVWWAIRHRGVGENLVAFLVILSTQAALTMSLLAAEQAWRARLVLDIIG